ncbi:hypothetical protein ABR330_20365 [Bacillus cabrialesii subsp. cabrialesii]|uniref:Rok-like winged helix domain-containing protein n=1 Tax=Bacillus cabrialesii TaxID=2487276 RepID=UPI00330606E0
MVDQKEALRVRLEELDKHEILILREFRSEREKIYSSLRALERSYDILRRGKKSQSLSEMIEQTADAVKTSHITSKPIHQKKRRQGRAESNASRKAALNILKLQDKPISSIDLKQKIEKETGRQISNMTIFMNHLMKKYPEVRKPHRGQYILEKT